MFVDDSPMEVAEVQRVFPEMECLAYPKEDYPAVLGLLNHLRNRFAKTTISAEELSSIGEHPQLRRIRGSEGGRTQLREQFSGTGGGAFDVPFG